MARANEAYYERSGTGEQLVDLHAIYDAFRGGSVCASGDVGTKWT